MTLSSRKGIQLSINMLVVIILGVVLLGMGIMLVTSMVDKGQSYSDEVDQQLMDQLRKSQFSDGRLVAVLSPQKEVSSGDTAYFVLGFRNNEDQPRNFRVVVDFNKDSSPVSSEPEWASSMEPSAADAAIYHDQKVSLEPNSDSFARIAIAPPKDLTSGQYFYDVYVCYDGSVSSYPEDSQCSAPTTRLYSGSKQRLFVNVR